MSLGVDYTAYAFIGLEIPPESLYATKIVPGCAHPEAVESLEKGRAFCPICGSHATKKEKVPAPGYDEEKEQFHGFSVVFGTDRQEAYLVADELAQSEGDGDMVDCPLSVERLAESMKLRLVSHELWDASRFGLWSVLHCSY